MPTLQQNYEASRAMFDEELIAALLENVDELLTSDEQEKLRECVRLAVEQQVRIAEIGVEAARRHATTEVEDRSRREAVGRWCFVLTMQLMEASASENLIEN